MQHQLLFANRVPKLADPTVRDALKFASHFVIWWHSESRTVSATRRPA